MIGTKKMPPPSDVRHHDGCGIERPETPPPAMQNLPARDEKKAEERRAARCPLLGQELARDAGLVQLDPLSRALFREDLDVHVANWLFASISARVCGGSPCSPTSSAP
jgi:hypothetical protein